jgi:starch-binding outer membrane protein, SusD/RagB family
MKIKIHVFFLVAGSIFGLAGCHKALELSPKDKITDQQLWQDQELVALYANNFYSQLRSGFGTTAAVGNGSFLLSCLTDDAVTANTSTNTGSARNIVTNAYTIDQSPVRTLWGLRYTYIRRASLFLDKIDHVPGDAQLNTRLKAEVRFLRAYYYYDLVSFFGGVPIIAAAQNENDSLFLPRNTIAECYDFITKELDSAANHLPVSYPASDLGRITKQAAWGLKCRVQMLRQDWAGAAATAKAIMDLGVNSLLANYSSVFTTANNAEIILSVQHNNSKDELGTNFDKNTWTPVAGGSGSNCPTQNLVDAYEMVKGKTFDPAKPYANRDLRFAATILFDSALFKNRPMQMFTSPTMGSDINPSAPGNSASTVTPTGYYLKKFTNENLNVSDANARSSYNWPLIRYAEILLNYAESQNEAAGPDASVYSAVNLLRKRGGIAELAVGNLTQAQMRDTIRHERRIELAFEDFRYWDVKRWGLAENLFSNTTNKIRRVNITINPATGARTGYTYSNIASYNSVFVSKNYLFPIPVEEIRMPGSKLTQNTGW